MKRERKNMVYSLIFAGGVGQRMNSKAKPKQFLEVHGEPIIVHTIKRFQCNKSIDKIIVVCVKPYIQYMKQLAIKFQLSKIIEVIPGGETGQESIFNGLDYLNNLSQHEDDIVLIHDGVRPIIDDDTINNNIECVKKNGNAVTVYNAIETIVLLNNDGSVAKVENRKDCRVARAPQSFYLKDIFGSHIKAIKDGKKDFIDSAMLMQYYGAKIFTVQGPANNIKITTPMDFFLFKAILDAKENEQINVL